MTLQVNTQAATIPLAGGDAPPIDQAADESRAYTLAGQQIDTTQKVQGQKDLQTIQGYLKSGGDLYSQEGIDKAVGDLKGQVSSDMYMHLTKYGQDFSNIQLDHAAKLAELPAQQYKGLQAQNQITLETLAPVLDTYTKAWQQPLIDKYGDVDKAPASEVVAAKQAALPAFQAAKAARIEGLKKMTAAGQNVVQPQVIQSWADMDPDMMGAKQKESMFVSGQLQKAAALQKELAQTKEAQAHTGYYERGNQNQGAPAGYQWADAEHTQLSAIPGGPAIAGTGRKGAPAGYEWDETGKTLKAIPGGPADPAIKGATQGNRLQVQTKRVAESATLAAADLDNLAELSLSSDIGVFGRLAGRHPTSWMDATSSALANEITPQSAQTYNAVISGIQRNLAGIEATGLAGVGGLTKQMDSVLFLPKDTEYTKLVKLAEIRQIIEKGLEPIMVDAPPAQKAQMQSVVDSTKASVPFTVKELIQLKRAQKKNPEATFASVFKDTKERQEPPKQRAGLAEAPLNKQGEVGAIPEAEVPAAQAAGVNVLRPPAIGTVEDGLRFKGGGKKLLGGEWDPYDEKNWEPAQQKAPLKTSQNGPLRKAINPQTGEELVLVDGQWQPLA